MLNNKLNERKKAAALRVLQANKLIDFCSNDYLGFSKKEWKNHELENGSGGSRLISGHSPIFDKAEKKIAHFHHAEDALIFNAGYNANLGLFSAVPSKGDTVIYDEYCHASIRDGLRLGVARNFSFQHNNMLDLKEKLSRTNGAIFVAVESIYSMDGDSAPLKEIAILCKEYNAYLIVDEAHATGIFGENGEGLSIQEDIETFARIHTFGKALGCHGAAITGSKVLKDFLINFSRPFIYTTALPKHSIENIISAYLTLENTVENKVLHNNIAFFKSLFKSTTLIPSDSPIQSIIIGGNEKTRKIAEQLQASGFDIRPILHPTIPEGSERIRICLHSFNTQEEITVLCKKLNQLL
tara:strand:- start:2058 stop:3119 length:1062 start_codon:yes stop_codon:yes gene_type:complete